MVARGQHVRFYTLRNELRRGGQRRDQQRERLRSNVSLAATVPPAHSRGRCLAGVTGPVTGRLVLPWDNVASCSLRFPFGAFGVTVFS